MTSESHTSAAHREPSHEEIMHLFQRLLDAYGPRYWWPAETPFEVIVGAILTQNTAWRNVEKALTSLRSAGLWSFESIWHASHDQLGRAIRSAGYFNQKAIKLKLFAEVVMREFEGDLHRLLGLETNALRERLLAIWGIGEETADDIVLYAARKPIFVIDTYTMRLVDRLEWKAPGNRYRDYQALFMEALPTDPQLFNEYHALIDRHGNTTCKKTPLCHSCCLVDICPTGQRQMVEASS